MSEDKLRRNARPLQTGTAVLARALRDLAQDADRRREMGASGRRYVAEHFDRNVLAARYLDLLKRLVR